MKSTSLFSLSLALLLALPVSTSQAVTMDRTGGDSSEPPFYVCHKNIDFVKAGGKPVFKIELKGVCGVRAGGSIPGWGGTVWKQITALAEYNYDTKVMEETIWLGPKDMVITKMTCNSNPWAHTPDCTHSSPPVNNTGVIIYGPYPLTAWRIQHSLRQSLAKWEITPTTAELLKDWNPYGQPQGAAKMKVDSPSNNQQFNENASNFQLAVSPLNNLPMPNWVSMEWQVLEETPQYVGDIAMPQDKPYWWQPYSGPATSPGADFPISPTAQFANKAGYYRVRVKDAASGGWSTNRAFQIGTPGFIPPKASAIDASKAMKIIAGQLGKQGEGQQLVMTRKTGKMKAPGKQLTLGGAVQTKQGAAPAGIGRALGKGDQQVKRAVIVKAPSSMPTTKLKPAEFKKLGGTARVSPQKTTISRAASSQIVMTKKPNLWFDLSTKPAPQPKLNKTFSLVFGVHNNGSGKNGKLASNNVIVDLECKPLDGGKCDQLLVDPIVPAIEPGQTKPMHLAAVFKPTKPGKYKVSMTLKPTPTGRGRVPMAKSWSMEFTIPKLTIKSDAMKKTIGVSPTQKKSDGGASRGNATRIRQIPSPR